MQKSCIHFQLCMHAYSHMYCMQSASMATNSIILLLVLSISCLCSTRDVYIQPSEGEHWYLLQHQHFGEMADSFSNSSGLNVYFLEGTHFLDLQELVLFTNLTIMQGDGRMEQGFHETVWQATVVIKCTEHSSTGIAFVNSSNITFRYITITNCGAYVQNSFYRSDRSTYASLGYLNVGNKKLLLLIMFQFRMGQGVVSLLCHTELT